MAETAPYGFADRLADRLKLSTCDGCEQRIWIPVLIRWRGRCYHVHCYETTVRLERTDAARWTPAQEL